MPAPTIAVSVESRMAEAVTLALLANTDLATWTEGRISRHEPTGKDQLVRTPCIFVWNDPSGWTLNRKPADFAQPRVTLVIMVVNRLKTLPVPLSVSQYTIVDWLTLIELILEQGSELDGTGSLVDPYAPATPTPVQKYLNTYKPETRRQRGAALSLTQNGDPDVIAWPIIAAYETQTNAETGGRQ